MKEIRICEFTGDFAENKDTAREIRLNHIVRALNKKEKVVINFEGVKSATQSFIHALLSDIIRKKGPGALNHIYFKNCSDVVKKIIEIVVEYMQDAF